MNGSIMLMCGGDSTSLKVIPATHGGENPAIGDIVDYLNFNKIDFTIPELNKAMANLGDSEIIIPLNNNSILPIRECMITEITDNNMTCRAKFMPPSDKGELMTEEEILGDLKIRGVVCGIDHDVIKNFLSNRIYFEYFDILTKFEFASPNVRGLYLLTCNIISVLTRHLSVQLGKQVTFVAVINDIQVKEVNTSVFKQRRSGLNIRIEHILN